MLPLDESIGALGPLDSLRIEGRVVSVVGLAIRAAIANARLGDLCVIERQDMPKLDAEIVGFDDDATVLVPFGSLEGIRPGDRVVSTSAPLSIRIDDSLRGRVLDGLGRPFDNGIALVGELRTTRAEPPHPLLRARISEKLVTGIRAIDAMLTVGIGQRIGLFAGSGVGKSTLLGQIARQSSADIVVVALVGERGREVREFLEDSLGEEGLRKSVVVCATSDAPALVRRAAASTATSIAEHFRDQGANVLLLVDSVTRIARASREVALASGEPPARRGYPPSVFAELPRLLERSGSGERGAITAIYTVLVEGSDMEEPVADEVRGILDGHILLDRALAARGRWPAIDVPRSLSRTMPNVTTSAHRDAASSLRTLIEAYESKRDLVQLGAYSKGSDQKLDRALSKLSAIEAFLCQRPDERSSFETTLARLAELA